MNANMKYDILKRMHKKGANVVTWVIPFLTGSLCLSTLLTLKGAVT